MSPARARLATWLAVGLALALHLPSLGWGFFADDYVHRVVLTGEVELTSLRPWALYGFGELREVPADSTESLSFPWWTSPDWKVRFFRPLASLSLWLDHVVLGDAAVLHHASGLLWFAAILALAAGLYRSLGLAPGIAALALVVFGLEDGTVIPVGWSANRNTIVEALCIAASMLVLVRGGARPGGRRIAVALVLAALAQLSKESGIAAPVLVALWLAHVGALRRGPLLACALLVAAHLALVVLGGYGARCQFYPTPWGEPLAYAGNGVVLSALAPLALAGPIVPDTVQVYPAALVGMTLVGGLLSIALVTWVVRRTRAEPRFAFLAAATVLTLVPQFGAPPSDRLLFVPMLFAAPLLALAIRARRSKFALVLLASTTVLSGLSLVARGFQMGDIAKLSRESVALADVGPLDGARRDMIVLQSASEITMLSADAVWLGQTGNRDVRFQLMQLGRRALRWTRVDERTFELESLGTPFGTGMVEKVFVSRPQRLAPGDGRSTSLLDVVVTAVDDGAPTAIRVTLPEPLESDRFRFLVWRTDHLTAIEPPAIGATLELPEPEPPLPFLP